MNILVRDIMRSDPVILEQSRTVFELREILILRQAELAIITGKEGKVSGLVTAVQLAAVTDRDGSHTVESVMERNFKTIDESLSVKEAASILSGSGFEALPVVDSLGCPLGIVTTGEIVQGLVEKKSEVRLTPESAAVYIAMTKDPEQEEYWLSKVESMGYKAAVTQVGAVAEKFPMKLREATIVAAIARSVIKEDNKEKFAVNMALRDVVNQFSMINPGLGGGFKTAIVRGDGRVAVAAFGRSGYSLINSNEQIFMGSNII